MNENKTWKQRLQRKGEKILPLSAVIRLSFTDFYHARVSLYNSKLAKNTHTPFLLFC